MTVLSLRQVKNSDKVELYGVVQPHSNMNCAQLARDVDTEDDAHGLTGFASFLFPPKRTQQFLVSSKSIHTYHGL